MSTPNRMARKAAAINSTANKVRASAGKTAAQPNKPIAGTGASRIAKPTLDLQPGGRRKGPAYEVPKPVKPRPVKK